MYTHGRCALHCLAVFVSLLAGCVVAPQQRQPLPPPNTAYEEIRRCRSDNQQAHAEVFNTYEAARRAGRINPGEAGQFNAMEARLRNVQIELARDGLSMQECQRIGRGPILPWRAAWLTTGGRTRRWSDSTRTQGGLAASIPARRSDLMR